MNKVGAEERTRVKAALLASEGLPGWNVKLEIGSGDCYLTAAIMGGRLVHVNLTVSRVGGPELIMRTHQVAVLEASKLDVTKALVEIACRTVNQLLQRGAWDVEDLIAAWRGTRFDPEGVCPQVRGIVSSPLDAAAKWLELKAKEGVLR
jgi:hypothetical protein